MLKSREKPLRMKEFCKVSVFWDFFPPSHRGGRFVSQPPRHLSRAAALTVLISLAKQDVPEANKSAATQGARGNSCARRERASR